MLQWITRTKTVKKSMSVLTTRSPYEFINVNMDGVINESLWNNIERFCYRADLLNEFRSDIKWEFQQVHIDRSGLRGPEIRGSLPNELVLEGLYRRFRFFILNKENSNYRKLLKGLGRAVTSETARLFFKYSGKSFIKTDLVKFAFISHEPKYSEEEIIDIWFNAFYFHDEDEKVKKLENYQDIVSKNGAKVTLFHVVWGACNEARNLRWLLKDTSPNNLRVLIPHYCRI